MFDYFIVDFTADVKPEASSRQMNAVCRMIMIMCVYTVGGKYSA